MNGYAVGGGLELALLCDLRVVENRATLGMLNRRFDIPLIDGGTVRLPRLIGLSRALDLIITGRKIDGETAFNWGIANRLVDTGTALGQALNLARVIADLPMASILADRRSAYFSSYDAGSLDDALDFEMECGLKCLNNHCSISKFL
ncbi:unnamed protein product [Soboliphyme baturini]|uniref:Enoyl-CoA hydratase n=1 Tax=Soboliphyme baturini TaxID=241478 RepID=A0A183IMQ5_9BILA|nr:unnamed protein product [Soboliphyme baturini]